MRHSRLRLVDGVAMTATYYVVLEKPKHANHGRPVWGHPVRGVAEDDAKARAKQWRHLSTYRVVEYVRTTKGRAGVAWTPYDRDD